ncbi:flagellar basal-body rod protein FlgC [Bartonella bacilliformis str. Heidi Mejia]|uniref:Flagellar basal-body rod protein FlgC n=2 Tax=Bartonella bacilliformis TaxID=774 RepID=A1UTU9_BARBK|nr:flagellar basal body rod protein FlgC [Bartonella bacilliformis]ABM45263.1 flagellar basal-body rod protein FlgC [Bartonella bacilliformis KC583]AMG86147.1 flagellar basal body rod protein FlgC [Bartonella bacilliformis]EKS43040.1 flagellar basal body rod protein FlgC [Bartonella bacilliformis INS]EYS88620.1 flagellar basal-body rod protein FlgC [Bartonella bacilliformis San Pedro600-02]EYS91044.1 flagellar basal-body rod protein FlgC [Bartonella bacilliformis str. Heidi Mejia]
MSDPLMIAERVSTTGLGAQSTRLRIIAENLANANSTGRAPGAAPYRRKTVSFETALNPYVDAQGVHVKRIGVDKAPFIMRYEPGHLAADSNGYVKYPNVNAVIEMADMREANRSYEANLQVIRQVRDLVSQTIDLLK